MATRFLAAGGLLLAWQLVRGAAAPNAREWRNAFLVGTLMLGGGMGGVAYAEQTIASGLVVAFIAVVPLLLVVINLAFRIHPQRGELLAVVVGLAGVLMLTQGQGLHGSPAGLIAIVMGNDGLGRSAACSLSADSLWRRARPGSPARCWAAAWCCCSFPPCAQSHGTGPRNPAFGWHGCIWWCLDR